MVLSGVLVSMVSLQSRCVQLWTSGKCLLKKYYYTYLQIFVFLDFQKIIFTQLTRCATWVFAVHMFAPTSW